MKEYTKTGYTNYALLPRKRKSTGREAKKGIQDGLVLALVE